MSLALIALVGLLVVSVIVGVYAAQSGRRRVQVLARASGQGGSVVAERVPLLVVNDPAATLAGRISRWAEERLPEQLIAEQSSQALVQAGFDSPHAPAVYALIRVVSAVTLPALAFTFGLRDSYEMLLLSGGIGIGLGLIAPPAMLSRVRRRRQERIRRQLPDCLDLLLVCVEAGVSLDAAILRVGRELLLAHPELAMELLVVNRKTNAGLRREDALHGLYDRTGVEELRSLASNMVQCERWGTSIGKVLRVYSESLRTKRMQLAEKKAALAATKMVFPLAMFILPALFAVVGGPVIIGIGPIFEALGQ